MKIKMKLTAISVFIAVLFAACEMEPPGSLGPGTDTDTDIPLPEGGSAISLPPGVWYIGTLAANGTDYYSFYAAPGTTFSVSWSDSKSGDGFRTADIKVSAYGSDGSLFFFNEDSAYYTPQTFTPTSFGLVTLEVTGFSATDSGTYAIYLQY